MLEREVMRECPFCGSTHQHIEQDRSLYFDYGMLYCVRCMCGAASCQALSVERAIEAWNRRAGEEWKHED